MTDVAEYLLKGELLNKRAIGDYLGEGYVGHTSSIDSFFEVLVWPLRIKVSM